MKKKIEVVNRYFYPVVGGIETSLLETFKRFNQRKWIITVHTSQNTYSSRNVLPERGKKDGIIIRRYASVSGYFFPKINLNKTDILILTNFTLLPHFFILLQIAWLKLLRKKKFIFIFSPNGGFIPAWETFKPVQRIIKKIIHYVFGSFLLNFNADVVHAISEWERNELVASGINNKFIKFIPNGIDNIGFKEKLTIDKKSAIKKLTSKKYIIQVARIHPIKNFEVTIRALAKLQVDINYVIAGDIEDQNYFLFLNREIKRLNMQNKVIFAGKITDEQKYYLIRNALCMVHMARNESFGKAVYEGLSQGLVCIVGDNTALKEAVKQGVNGFRVSTDDIDELARKINFVILNQNSKSIENIKKNNKKKGQNYKWDTMARRYEGFCTSLLNWSIS